MKEKIKKWFGCYDPNEDRITDAENIIMEFDCMLSVAHLSENKSLACQFSRQSISEYKKKWGLRHGAET